LYRHEKVSLAFLRSHINDFNNCKANVEMIAKYLEENKLEWTTDNLELAFVAKESELAPVERPVAPVVPANPVVTVTPTVVAVPAAPVVTAPVVPAAPVVVQPVVAAPAPVTPPANPVVIAPRPGVNAGIIPGQNSGIRPAAQPTGLTAEEIKSWDAATMRKNMKNPSMRAQIEKFVADRNATRGR
jgi:hypothetical protein